MVVVVLSREGKPGRRQAKRMEREETVGEQSPRRLSSW